jgi:tetratricopeptide (TPR) repeat protein
MLRLTFHVLRFTFYVSRFTFFVILLFLFTMWTLLPVAGQNEDKVIIGQPEIGELFAAVYRHYQSHSAGSVSVQNNTNENLRAETSVTVAEYAPEPLTIATLLPAGKTTQVPLRIDFNLGKLPNSGGPLALDADVEVSVYSEDKRVCQKQLSARLQLHNLSILPDEPPEAVAAFIDPTDQSVTEFAKTAKAGAGLPASDEQLRGNSKTAQRLFELMQQARVICMNQAARTVRYPRELLRTRIGGSYDCALLYAALLENSNVPSALMVSDEYILVLFQQQGQIAEQQVNDELWIPLDIRMLKASFSEAKAAGLKAYENLKREGKARPFILREAWKQYKPMRVLAPQSVKEIQLGITYVQRGELDRAERIFNNHLNSNLSAAAYNNLGNISLGRGSSQEAISRYLKALEDDPGDGAIYLNLGIAYAVEDENKEAAAMFDRAFEQLGSYARMCYVLGLKLDSLDHKAVRWLMQEAEERALQSRTRPLGIRAKPDGEQLPLYWKKY